MTKTRLFFAEVTVTNKWRLSLATCSCSFQRLGIWHPPLSAAPLVAALLGADPQSHWRGKTRKQSREIQLAAGQGMERPHRHQQLSPHPSSHTMNQPPPRQEPGREPHP